MWTVEVPPSDDHFNDGFLGQFFNREAAVRKARLWAEEDKGARYTLLDPHGVPDGYMVWDAGKVEYRSLPRR